jgi:hypothetical protein
MVVPDFALISEIMMVAEGFLEARLLARKFITLYTLCRELLSKQASDMLRQEPQGDVTTGVLIFPYRGPLEVTSPSIDKTIMTLYTN